VPALATMTITVNGLQPNDPMSVAITAPSSQIGVTPSRSGRNFTFRLDPGTNPGNGFAYSFQASSPGFISATVEGGPFTFAPGQTLTRSVSLTEREVSGTVTGATNNTRVELRDEDENVVDFTATNGSGDYTFEGVDAGTWKIVSASFGVGRGETTRTITPTSPSITDADFNLVARNVTVSYTVNPTDATVVLRSGNTTVDSVPPLVGTERQLPFTLRASRTGFVTQDVAVPSPSPDGSFDALSFTVNAGAITLAPVPTTTTTTTTTTTSTTSTTSTTVN
jgi:hypothetical protein